jgi:hypothetical protein
MPTSPEVITPEILPPPVTVETAPIPQRTIKGIGGVATTGVYRSTGNLETGPELVDVEESAPMPREPEGELGAVGMARVVYDDEANPNKGFTVHEVSHEEKQDYILQRTKELAVARAWHEALMLNQAIEADETSGDDVWPGVKRKKDKTRKG